MSKKILIIDTSHMLFRAFYAFPQNLFDPEKNHINAVFGVAQMILSIIESQHPTHIFAAQDLPKKTKRSELFSEYKGQRPELDINLKTQIPRIYEMLKALNIAIVSQEGYEADDVIATIAEHFRGNAEYEVCIVTGDQDAFQLIGENVCVLRPVKNELKKYTDALLMAEKSLFPSQIPDFKGLAGDQADNLKGVEGIGEKTANNLLEKYKTLEGIYKALEKGEISGAVKKKLETGKEIAFFTRSLATLHRDICFDSFDEHQGRIENCTPEKACAFFQSIGSNSLQKRTRQIFQTTAEANPPEKPETKTAETVLQTLF